MLLYTYLYVHSHFDKIRPQIYTHTIHTHTRARTHSLTHSLKHTKKVISNSTVSVNMTQLAVHMRHHTTFISLNIIAYIFSRQSNLTVLLIN